MSVSRSAVLHPALARLLRDRTTGTLRQVYRNLRNPRKVVLSVIAVLLAFLWMGNAILSLLFREPYSLKTVQTWIPVILGIYALWHVVRVAWQRPEQPIEWSPAEQQYLCGGPFTRRELLRYRLTAVTTATLFKAFCASLLLIPELPLWPVGFLGVLLALLFIELLRMALDVVACGATRRGYLGFRFAVFTSLALVAGWVVFVVGGLVFGSADTQATSTVQVMIRTVNLLSEITNSTTGRTLLVPLHLFAELITSSQVTTVQFARTLLSSLMIVAVTGWLVIQLDQRTMQAAIRHEREAFARTPARQSTAKTMPQENITLSRVPRLSGVGPIVWRQWIALSRYKGELALALAAPVVLSLLPLLQPLSPRATFLHVTAGMMFYSFVLLPPALKFDFRRDYERLGALKKLPLPPLAIVVGQLAAPVIVVSAFQIALLTLTAAIRPIAPSTFAITVAVLIPLNVLIFGLENLMFLLAPHRLKQEGIEVFLRTMLVFTAKAVIFGIGLISFSVWSVLSNNLSAALQEIVGIAIDSGVLLLAGCWIAIGSAAWCTLAQLARVFRRIDPVDDIS